MKPSIVAPAGLPVDGFELEPTTYAAALYEDVVSRRAADRRSRPQERRVGPAPCVGVTW